MFTPHMSCIDSSSILSSAQCSVHTLLCLLYSKCLTEQLFNATSVSCHSRCRLSRHEGLLLPHDSCHTTRPASTHKMPGNARADLDAVLQLLPTRAKQLSLHVCLQHSSKMRCLMSEELQLAKSLLGWARPATAATSFRPPRCCLIRQCGKRTQF